MSESAVIDRPTVECNGETFPYRPDSWDAMPFVRISDSNLYEVIQGEAIEENARRGSRSRLFEEAAVSTPMQSHYRNNAWEETTIPFRLHEENNSFATRVARGIYNEAVIANDEFDAYVEGLKRQAPAPVADITLSTYERDQEAALAQAEVLGATADQRRKLRAIVEAEHNARRRVEELQAQVARLSGDIDDPNDRRVWGIFGKAAREANKQGYCSVYDQISQAVGIPRRDDLKDEGYLNKRRWDVRVAVSVSYTEYVTVTVEADTDEEAIREADRMSLADIFEYMDSTGHYLERSDLDSHNAEEAEEVDE